MEREYFNIFIEEVPNMSDKKVTIFTNPKNKDQLTCMIMQLTNMFNEIEGLEE